MKDKEKFLKKGNTKKYNKKKSKFYYKSISRHLSKKFLTKNSLAINSSNMILKVFKKKNTVNLSNERILNKKLLKILKNKIHIKLNPLSTKQICLIH